MNPGLQDFGPMNYLRRTDSKDSSCTSLSSASHMHDRALTASMSVPAVAFGVSIYLETLKNEIFGSKYSGMFFSWISIWRTFRFRTNLGGQTAQIAQLLASPLLARCLAFQETTQRRQDQILMDHKELDPVVTLLSPFLMGIYKVTDTKSALAL